MSSLDLFLSAAAEAEGYSLRVARGGVKTMSRWQRWFSFWFVHGHAIHAFLAALKVEFGNGITNMAARDLCGRLRRGQPLTARKVVEITAAASCLDQALEAALADWSVTHPALPPWSDEERSALKREIGDQLQRLDFSCHDEASIRSLVREGRVSPFRETEARLDRLLFAWLPELQARLNLAFGALDLQSEPRLAAALKTAFAEATRGATRIASEEALYARAQTLTGEYAARRFALQDSGLSEAAQQKLLAALFVEREGAWRLAEVREWRRACALAAFASGSNPEANGARVEYDLEQALSDWLGRHFDVARAALCGKRGEKIREEILAALAAGEPRCDSLEEMYEAVRLGRVAPLSDLEQRAQRQAQALESFVTGWDAMNGEPLEHSLDAALAFWLTQHPFPVGAPPLSPHRLQKLKRRIVRAFETGVASGERVEDLYAAVCQGRVPLLAELEVALADPQRILLSPAALRAAQPWTDINDEAAAHLRAEILARFAQGGEAADGNANGRLLRLRAQVLNEFRTRQAPGKNFSFLPSDP